MEPSTKINEDIFVQLSEDSGVGVATDYELRVLDGLHKGASLILSGERIAVGSNHFCDIVLLDEGVLAEHLQLDWSPNFGWVDSKHPNSKTNGFFRLGAALVCVVRSGTPWVYEMPHVDVAEARAVSKINPNIELPLIGNHPGKIRPKALQMQPLKARKLLAWICLFLSLALIFAWLQTNIFALSNTSNSSTEQISITAPPTHVLDSPIFPSTVDKPLQEEPTPRFSAVVMGATPYLVLQDGQHLYTGERVDGFYLMELSPGKIVWRGTDVVEVKW